MSGLTGQQRSPLRFAVTKVVGDREAPAERIQDTVLPTPTLQGHAKGGAGIVLILIIGLAVLAYAASGGFP